MNQNFAAQLSKDIRKGVSKQHAALSKCGDQNLSFFGRLNGLRMKASDPVFAAGLCKWAAGKIEDPKVVEEIMRLGRAETDTPLQQSSDTSGLPEVIISVRNDPALVVPFSGLGLRQTRRGGKIELRGHLSPDSVRELVKAQGGSLTILEEMETPSTQPSTIAKAIEETNPMVETDAPRMTADVVTPAAMPEAATAAPDDSPSVVNALSGAPVEQPEALKDNELTPAQGAVEREVTIATVTDVNTASQPMDAPGTLEGATQPASAPGSAASPDQGGAMTPLVSSSNDPNRTWRPSDSVRRPPPPRDRPHAKTNALAQSDA